MGSYHYLVSNEVLLCGKYYLGLERNVFSFVWHFFPSSFKSHTLLIYNLDPLHITNFMLSSLFSTCFYFLLSTIFVFAREQKAIHEHMLDPLERPFLLACFGYITILSRHQGFYVSTVKVLICNILCKWMIILLLWLHLELLKIHRFSCRE